VAWAVVERVARSLGVMEELAVFVVFGGGGTAGVGGTVVGVFSVACRLVEEVAVIGSIAVESAMDFSPADYIDNGGKLFA
jgi:hypothetical protein